MEHPVCSIGRIEDSNGDSLAYYYERYGDILKNGFLYDFHKKGRHTEAWKNEGQTILLTTDKVSRIDEKKFSIGTQRKMYY